jgi:hypothetical protein
MVYVAACSLPYSKAAQKYDPKYSAVSVCAQATVLSQVGLEYPSDVTRRQLFPVAFKFRSIKTGFFSTQLEPFLCL